MGILYDKLISAVSKLETNIALPAEADENIDQCIERAKSECLFVKDIRIDEDGKSLTVAYRFDEHTRLRLYIFADNIYQRYSEIEARLKAALHFNHPDLVIEQVEAKLHRTTKGSESARLQHLCHKIKHRLSNLEYNLHDKCSPDKIRDKIISALNDAYRLGGDRVGALDALDDEAKNMAFDAEQEMKNLRPMIFDFELEAHRILHDDVISREKSPFELDPTFDGIDYGIDYCCCEIAPNGPHAPSEPHAPSPSMADWDESAESDLSEIAEEICHIPPKPEDQGHRSDDGRDEYEHRRSHYNKRLEVNSFGASGSSLGFLVGAARELRGFLRNSSQRRKVYDDVSATVFAPASVKRGNDMHMRVKIHETKDYQKILDEIRQKDPSLVSHDTTNLNVRLSQGAKIDIHVTANGVELNRDRYSVIWQGRACEVIFIADVPTTMARDHINFCIDFKVDGLPVGSLAIKVQVVDYNTDANCWAKAEGGKYKHVFISYSSDDVERVRYLHEAYESVGIPHFFDKSNLKPGEEYWEVIHDTIQKTDLFVLCWSKNAATSGGVEKEKGYALDRYDIEKAQNKAGRMRFYTLDITPHADLPEDMKSRFHFGKIE